MTRVCLDISANTHKNDWPYLKKMIDEIKAIDTKECEIVFKHQLFVNAGDNIPLKRSIFNVAWHYADKLGYKTTSSVFDIPSLEFLLQYNIPYVKIANRRCLDYLMGEIPRKIPVYISYGSYDELKVAPENAVKFLCVSKYPAEITDYETNFGDRLNLLSFMKTYGLSDHTTDFRLFETFKPNIIEWHYKLEDSTGLDAGIFARTPEQLREVL